MVGVHEGEDLGEAGDRTLMDVLFSPAGRDNPQAAARDHPTLGCRYHVVQSVLRDSSVGAPAMPPSTDAMFQLLSRFMARLDDERHHAIRALFARTFTPKRAAAYGGLIAKRAQRLLDSVEPRGSMDLVNDYARPLPFGVISDVLGVPTGDQPWLEHAMETLGAAFAGQRNPALVEHGNGAVRDMLAFFDQLMTARAAVPADDLVSILANDRLAVDARDDLLANCIFFVLAGHATTTTLLAAGAALLCDHPDQLRELQARPTGWSAAVEELLRYISPITLTGVGVSEDIAIRDTNFLAGNRVLCFSAANRDADVFRDPDRLDLGRDPNPHLAFSFGSHHCPGAPLARLHGQIGLPTLFTRLPGIQLLDEPSWRGSTPLRQLAHAQVAWQPRRTIAP